MASEFQPAGDFTTDWSWSNPPITGTVYVIDDLNQTLRASKKTLFDAWTMLERVCQSRRWFIADLLVFESFDDAVGFRLGFDTGPIREMLVEEEAGTE